MFYVADRTEMQEIDRLTIEMELKNTTLPTDEIKVTKPIEPIKPIKVINPWEV